MTKKNDILIEALRPYANGRSEQELEEGANNLMEFVKLIGEIHKNSLQKKTGHD